MQSTNKKKFANISTVLNTILEKNNLSHLYALDEISRNWKVFDKTISAHSTPVDFDYNSGILKIRVENAIWKKEFIENIATLTVKIKNSFRIHNIKHIEII